MIDEESVLSDSNTKITLILSTNKDFIYLAIYIGNIFVFMIIFNSNESPDPPLSKETYLTRKAYAARIKTKSYCKFIDSSIYP